MQTLWSAGFGRRCRRSRLLIFLLTVGECVFFYSTAVRAQPWMNTGLAPEQRAGILLTNLTQDEKVAMVHGWSGRYVGDDTNITRLGIPALHLQDGPAGVADWAPVVTAMPAPIALAATWDTELARQYGTAIGAEAYGKGVHVLLGPMIHIVRVPQSGRAFETFGEDPFLAAAMAAAHIQGVQSQNVIATAKHFIANDQETDRGNANSIVDERTLQEIYFPPFLAAVRAGVGSICASYNQLNGTWASELPELNSLVKGAWGFKGFIMPDWGANFSTEKAAANGLDMEMPYDVRFGPALQTAIAEGHVPQWELDGMVRRIFASMFRFGIFDHPAAGTLDSTVTNAAHIQLAREVAAEGMVLLKNKSGVLPLKAGAIHSIAVLGSAGGFNPIWTGTGSAQCSLPYYDIPVDAISNRAGLAIKVAYAQGDGGHIPAAVQLARQSDVAIVCVGQQTGEGGDRSGLGLPGDQASLVASVAAANPRTIVVLYEGAGTLMRWSTNVAAILVAWFPGQEGGRALASVLFGDVNPSGKLPVTFPAAANEVPANTPAQFPGIDLQVHYSEGMLMGYRWYDASNIAPRFAFGSGLSYTTFGYSNLTVSAVSPSGEVTIGTDLSNTGTRAGAEVAQLYLKFPPAAHEPPRVLKGFQKAFLQPGQARHLNFSLDWEDLAFWNANSNSWQVPLGTFQVLVGASSRDIRLQGSFSVSTPIPPSGRANLALFQPVSASSNLAPDSAAGAVDGNPKTRWTSAASDPQWLTVDLGALTKISRVRLEWDTNYARSFQIRLSADALSWTSAYMTSNALGGSQDLIVAGSARYVQLYATQWSGTGGCSLSEFEIYGAVPQSGPTNIAQTVSGSFSNSAWAVECHSRASWSYALQRSTNLASWEVISAPIAGDGTILSFLDSNPPPVRSFYRIEAVPR